MRSSMSRGRPMAMESFFGILKTEMFTDLKKILNSQLEQAITESIFLLQPINTSSKTKELSPVQYRTKSFQ